MLASNGDSHGGASLLASNGDCHAGESLLASNGDSHAGESLLASSGDSYGGASLLASHGAIQVLRVGDGQRWKQPRCLLVILTRCCSDLLICLRRKKVFSSILLCGTLNSRSLIYKQLIDMNITQAGPEIETAREKKSVKARKN